MNCFAKTVFLAVTIGYTVIGAPFDISKENYSVEGAISQNYEVERCPRIVTRGEWHARPSSSPYSPMVMSPAPYIVAHHGGIPHYCYDEETCSRIVRGYQDFHMDTHGWIDIGYHFVIGGDGNVYEGRGWDHVGAHAPGYNGQGIGICIIGDYTCAYISYHNRAHYHAALTRIAHMPNNASLEAFKSLIECGVSIGKVTSDYKLIGHRQGRDTECPGQTFFDYLKTLSHFDASPVPMRGILITAKVAETKPDKPRAPVVDITGSKLWDDLIALGVPETSSAKSRTDETVEENVVDTGNSGVKIPSKRQ